MFSYRNTNPETLIMLAIIRSELSNIQKKDFINLEDIIKKYKILVLGSNWDQHKL